ncbi:hypothetical protein T492DRAFT_977235 [Pavlovales sp. CCMP2436]|nr:hypothetical protein T492DRAFT_977235 [Pavlovales sp. CCMP2436]
MGAKRPAHAWRRLHGPAGGTGPSGWLLGRSGRRRRAPPPASRRSACVPRRRQPRRRAAVLWHLGTAHCAPRCGPAIPAGGIYVVGGSERPSKRSDAGQGHSRHSRGAALLSLTIYLPRLRLHRTIYLPPPRSPPLLPPSTPTSAAVASSCRLTVSSTAYSSPYALLLCLPSCNERYATQLAHFTWMMGACMAPVVNCHRTWRPEALLPLSAYNR